MNNKQVERKYKKTLNYIDSKDLVGKSHWSIFLDTNRASADGTDDLIRDWGLWFGITING